MSVIHLRPLRANGRQRRSTPAQLGVLDLRAARDRRSHRSAALQSLGDSLLSLAGVLGTDIKDPSGESVGRLKDVVVRWTSDVRYPPVTAIVVRVGLRDAAIDASDLTAPDSARDPVSLASTSVIVRALERRPDEVALAHDVLDQQLVDSSGLEVARPADVYLAAVDESIALVGIEISPRALIRRLGPARLRRRARPYVAIDWAEISSFTPTRRQDAEVSGDRAALAGQVDATIELGATSKDLRQLGPNDIDEALRSPQAQPKKASP